MKQFFTLILICISASLTAFAQKEKVDLKLTLMLKELTKGFNGEVGVYVKNLKTGKIAEVDGDSIFPTASMIKVPIMAGIFNKIEKGALDYRSVLTYRDSLLYKGDDLLGSFKDGEKITLGKVLMLMAATSDNTASLWAQSLAGTGTEINALMESYGLQYTRVNSRTPGRTANQKKYGWGQTTPREMATLLTLIREGKLVSPAASERIYRNLTTIFFDGQAPSQIPPDIEVASKSGAVDRSRSEVLLVNAPDYVFCIITKNQKDTSWTYNNEGYAVVRAVSKALWEYFEPKSTWVIPKGMDKYFNYY